MHRTVPDETTSALGYQWIRPPARVHDEQVVRQARAIEDFCRRRGWDLCAVVRDHAATSRKGAGQPALRDAVERLRAGEASRLVVAELRQLSPSVAELGPILAAIDEANAHLVSLDPAFDTATPIGRTIGRMLTAISGWERERRSEMAAAVPPQVKRRILRMREAGMTLQAIADELNEEGVPTVPSGAEWRPSSVQATLRHERPPRWGPSGDGEPLRI